MMSCAYVISRFGPSITRLAGRTRPERWENAYELRKSGLTLRDYADIRVMPTFPRSPCSSRVSTLKLSA